MVTAQDYRKALNNLPRCIGGIDYAYHVTVDDLVFLVEHEINLFNEGEESDIYTQTQLKQCSRYVDKWSPLS